MSLGLIIFFIVLGIVLLVIEFMLMPGVVIAGVGGAIFVIGGVIMAFVEHGPADGLIVLASTVAAMIVVVIMVLRAGTWKSLMLTTAIDSKVDLMQKDERPAVSPGDRGESITRLNPIGRVVVNGDYYEAKALDILIDPKTEVEVISVEGNKLIVKPIKQ